MLSDTYAVTIGRKLRFAVQQHGSADAAEWRRRAQSAESQGYSALYLPDHFSDQLAPIAALISAADATSSLRVGSLVFDNDYRHPVVLAKEAATLDMLSGGTGPASLTTAPARASSGWRRV